MISYFQCFFSSLFMIAFLYFYYDGFYVCSSCLCFARLSLFAVKELDAGSFAAIIRSV